jgi:predicted nicotinamide N-methyase
MTAVAILQARKAGAVPLLTRLLKRPEITEDEDLVDAISTIMASCSGPMALGGRVRTLSYGGNSVTVNEGALGDGVGARVWTVAHTLCQALAARPELVKESTVLELGAGCGVCGLLAAKLGASEVVLSDYVDTLLLNLRNVLHMNEVGSCTTSAAFSFEDGLAASESPRGRCDGQARKKLNVDDDEERKQMGGDPEDDDSTCSEGELLEILNGHDGCRQANGRKNTTWDSGVMSVRFADWEDSVAFLDGLQENRVVVDDAVKDSTPRSPATTASTEEPQKPKAIERTVCALDGPSTRSAAPQIPFQQKFDVVLGTDVLYETSMAVSLPAAVMHRLSEGGIALLCCAVRDQAMFDLMLRNLVWRGLTVKTFAAQPKAEDGGVVSIQHDYEGGYVVVTAEHERFPYLKQDVAQAIISTLQGT